MKLKIVIGGIVILVAIIYGAMSFIESNVEYTNFQKAKTTGKKVQIKGYWVREKETSFDVKTGEFTFYMVDENEMEERVIYKGAKPNNFEIADAIVIKGHYDQNKFRASEILTKCPSKYASPQ